MRLWIPLKRIGYNGVLIAIVCLVVGIFVVVALTAPWVSPFDPNAQDLVNRLKPPIWMDGAVKGHIFGTDNLGRDVLSRVIYGSRVSILVGLFTAIIAGTIGSVIGLLSGYYKILDGLFMRIADIQLAFPTILLALAVVAVIGGSMTNLILVLGVTGWVGYARIVRAEVMRIKSVDYVLSAALTGASDFRILFRHILPNIFSPIITIATFQVAAAIIAESSLSYLGMGIPIQIPSWGSMLNEGQRYLDSAWWIALVPGVSIMMVILAINILGDMLRDKYDPKSRSR